MAVLNCSLRAEHGASSALTLRSRRSGLFHVFFIHTVLLRSSTKVMSTLYTTARYVINHTQFWNVPAKQERESSPRLLRLHHRLQFDGMLVAAVVTLQPQSSLVNASYLYVSADRARNPYGTTFRLNHGDFKRGIGWTMLHEDPTTTPFCELLKRRN